MIDSLLDELIDSETPKINPDIANGIALRHMTQAEQYINDILTNVAKDFPKGLEYLGCQRCTPVEEFNNITNKSTSNRKSFDIAESSIYLMKYFFRFEGKDLPPRHIFLPFVSTAGSITLSGSKFVISPILTDRVFSIGVQEVFVRLLRAKMKCYRSLHNIVINGYKESVQVVWSEIYNKSATMKKLKSPVNAKHTLAHYLFCKYGFAETMQRFTGCTPIVGREEINNNTFPDTEWVICESTRIAPRGAMRGFYEPTSIRVAIRKDQFTSSVKSLIAGFFYVIDFFPRRFSPEHINNTTLWRIALGIIIFTDTISEGKLIEDISKHIMSLDEYMDNVVIVKLKDIGYDVKDLYQLFYIIIQNFNDWLLKAPDNVNSMYNKELSILYDVLYEITKNIFDMHFKLKAQTKKKLTENEIRTIMNATLRPRAIFNIMKTKKGVSTVSYSGDNKFFKITSMLVPQSSSGGKSSKKERVSVEDPQYHFHSSIAEVGSFLFLPKADPSGHARISPFLQLSPNGSIQRDPNKAPLLDAIQEKIKRR